MLDTILKNPILFGHDPTEGIVAAELKARFIRLFIRTPHGVIFRDDPFKPFILISEPKLLTGASIPHIIEPLKGPGVLAHKVSFDSWQMCTSAKDYLRGTTMAVSAPDAPYLFISDPVHQHLLSTGKTLFKGLQFQDLVRLALDIETTSEPGAPFPSPLRPTDRIISIALASSNGSTHIIKGAQVSEAEMLEELNHAILRINPDVIEGHNIFRFDLHYLRVRAAMCGVKLRWGRDGSEPHFHSSRFTAAERILDYPRCNIFGRHVVDSYFLLLLHDLSTRDLENHGLKTAARHFGLALPERISIEGDQIAATFRKDPERIYRYNLDDAKETLALAGHLSYPHFLQTQMFPYNYQVCVVRGTATRINSLFIRTYLHRGMAIPQAASGADIVMEGAYTDLLKSGVVGPVLHCDVASLYPSILLSYGLQPSKDALAVFLPLLADLRNFRLAAKRASRMEVEPEDREYYSALQQAFKILINSFYGYLGTTIHNFSDPAIAARVTALGRETLQTMIKWLERRGAICIEVDTDGIYFIPPPDIKTEHAEEELVRELSNALPLGLDVELDGRYRAMFSYKVKNYALLGYDGSVIIKGSGLKSRGMEKYLREFLRAMIVHLLEGRGLEVEELYHRYLDNLRHHRVPITSLAKYENLRESSTTYRKKLKTGQRNPSAAYELALQVYGEFHAGEHISYYISGHDKGVTAYQSCKAISSHDPSKPDENVAFYIDKLRHLKKKFEPFLPLEPTLF